MAELAVSSGSRPVAVDVGSVAPFYLVGLAVWVAIRLWKGAPFQSLIPKVAFLVYVLVVSRYVLFPLRFDSGYVDTMRSQTSILDGINMVPLAGLHEIDDRQVIGNAMLGIPFGFLWPFLSPRAQSVTGVVRIGALAFVSVELVQLVISLGYGFAYRVIDVNDVLLNVTGVAIGGSVLLILSRVLRSGKSPELAPLPANWADVLMNFRLSGSRVRSGSPASSST